MTVINWSTLTEDEALSLFHQMSDKFGWTSTPTTLDDVLIYREGDEPEFAPDAPEMTPAMRAAVLDTYEWRKAIPERSAELCNMMAPTIMVKENGDWVLHTESYHDVLYSAEGEEKPQIYVESFLGGLPEYGPFEDEVEASFEMDKLNLSDHEYKMVWRSA